MATILTKKKDTSGAPSAGDLTNDTGGAELAVNTADKRLYTKDSGGNVVEVGINPTSITTGTLNTSGAVVFNDAGADVDFRVEGDTDANLLFVDASTDRVGIGTSTPAEKLDVVGTYIQSADTRANNTNKIFSLRMPHYANATNPINLIGGVGFSGSNPVYIGGNDTSFVGTAATSIQFYTAANNTTASGTERVRITSGGFFKASNTGTYVNATSSPHELISNVGGANVLNIVNSSANPYGPVINFSGASPDNNSNYFLACADSTATRMYIYSDGDVWTADAGTLSSDQKLKNTITDASPKLDDVMKLRVRNFYWNKDYHPEKTDKKLIGFIAQEFEEVFPGLVTEGVIRGGNPIYEDQAVVDEEGNPVLDEEGNAKTEQVQVGETEKEYAKGIKEGKLIPILVKALQEAVERIETLEAKVAALENA